MKTSLFFFVILVFWLATPRLWAQENLREQAEQEIVTQPAPASKEAQKNAETQIGALSAEQTESILRLQDRYEEPALRHFQWTLGIQVQSYKPSGHGDIDDVTNENLGDIGSTVMPSLSLGTLYLLGENLAGAFQWGLEGEGSFASQAVSVTTQTGENVSARLNTTEVEARTLLRWGAHTTSALHLRAGVGVGHFNITQSSDNSLVRWTKGGDYTDWIAGLDYRLSRSWYAMLTYKNLTERSNFPEQIDLPNSQLELGAQILW